MQAPSTGYGRAARRQRHRPDRLARVELVAVPHAPVNNVAAEATRTVIVLAFGSTVPDAPDAAHPVGDALPEIVHHRRDGVVTRPVYFVNV
jgi:hypothetical protein